MKLQWLVIARCDIRGLPEYRSPQITTEYR